jgi:hypothetical protein
MQHSGLVCLLSDFVLVQQASFFLQHSSFFIQHSDFLFLQHFGFPGLEAKLILVKPIERQSIVATNIFFIIEMILKF